MSNVKHVSILAYVLFTVLLADICGNEVSATSDLLINEKLNAESGHVNWTLHVKYLPGLILEVEGISGFRVFWLRYPDRFENYLEVRFAEDATQNEQMRGKQNDEISSTLWNYTQMDSCREVSRSSGIKLNSNGRVRIWFTFHGSFKAGLGVDLSSFRFLQFDPLSFLDFISHVSFGSSGSPVALRINRTPFINKCLLMTNESLAAIHCGNELTDEAVCVSCGCCYNPDILPTMPCFKPIGNFDLMDYGKCAVPVSKVADNVQFRNNGPKCVGFNVTFTLAYYKKSYDILKLSFDVDFGDGVSFQNQRFLPSNDSVGIRKRQGYTWQSNHSYTQPGLYEVSVTYSNGVKSSDVLIAKTDVVVERALLQPEDYHVIHDRPAIVGDAMNVMVLLQLYSEPLSMLASVNDSKAMDKVVFSKSLGLAEWLEDSLDAELKLLGPLYKGVLKSMNNDSGTDSRKKSIYQGLFRHVFTKAGDYSISFVMTTVCGSMTVNRTLSVQEGSKVSFADFVGVVDIVTNGSVAVHEVVGIVVSMQHFTKNTYVEIHLGDDSAAVTFLPARGLPLPLWAVQKIGTRQDYSSVTTSHRYTVGGKYRVQVIIEDVVLNQHITKTVDVEVTCYANITFPGHDGPILQPVNEPLLVRRDIVQNCTSAHPTEEWLIYQGTSESDHLPLPVNVEIRPRVGLVVPPYTLVPAVYTIEIKALIPLSKDSGHKTISNQLQVEFVSAGILTGIRAPDTHTLAFDSVLMLDASNSKDLDDPARSGLGLSFTWFCSTINDFAQADPLSTVEGSSCNEARPLKLPSTDAVLRYRTGHLFNKAEIREIWFHVRVAKPGKRPSNATHAVRLVRSYDSPLGGEEAQPGEDGVREASDGFNPYVVIICIQNCNKTIDPNEQLELSVLCVNCYMSDVLSYQWSFTTHGKNSSDGSRPTVDLEAAAKYGTDKSDVIVEAGTFEDIGKQEKCTISVKVTFPTRKEVTVRYDFSVQPPDATSYTEP